MIVITHTAVVLICLCRAIAIQAQSDTLCRTLPWEAALVRDVNIVGAEGLHSASALVSDALLPVTLGIPAGMYFFGILQPVYTILPHDYRYLAETGLQAAVTQVLTYGVALGVKAATNTPRPFRAFPDCIRGYQDPLGTSFPSGHAAGSAALATTLSLRYPHWYVITPSVVYALATGISRLHLGVHYLSDVLAGYLLGTGVAILVHTLRNTLFDAFDGILPSDQLYRFPVAIIRVPL